jgi:tRNA (guanine-N7-)-methyltransferase
LLELSNPPALLDWPALFGNDHPVEAEVGFGKGLFLLTAAGTCPQTNFVGIEIVRKYQLYAATRMAKRGLRNVRLACGDARLVLRDRVPAASLQAVHVYYPDPWWKKRHMKRRVFTPEFAAQCERVLHPGGRLHIVTDVADYFAVMTGLIGEQTLLHPLPPPEEKDAAHDLDYLTNFERKFRKEGRPIYRAAYVKRQDPSTVGHAPARGLGQVPPAG